MIRAPTSKKRGLDKKAAAFGAHDNLPRKTLCPRGGDATMEEKSPRKEFGLCALKPGQNAPAIGPTKKVYTKGSAAKRKKKKGRPC